MAALALALWIVYFALSFGLRDTLHRRRTGHTGLLMAAARPWSLQWNAEVMQVVAIALGVAAAALAPTIEPLTALDVAGLHIAGIALYAGGLIGVVASQQTMGDSWRIGQDSSERTDLVTRGPFALVRNPIFSALVLVQLGLALLVLSPLAIAGVVLLLISIELQVRLVEEPHLVRAHGAGYSAYASRVGRFVPRLGRLDG